MKYTTLPTTEIKVSKICLGTMTWGQQNTLREAHEQMDYAISQGINFFDTAEMYSIPGKPETYGATEKIIGSWFKKNKNRDQVILASKIAGPGYAHIRKTGFSKMAIHEALEGSLKRLQTDYIDLYQLHWPERPTNCFGIREYPYQKDTQWEDNFSEVLTTLQECIQAGKIRHIGVSNETPWGLMRYLEESKQKSLPRMVTLQNAYSLIQRSVEIGLSEVLLKENVGLLPYSPLAFGVLSGKYLNKSPKDARVNLFPAYNRYSSPQATTAVEKYAQIASQNGLSLAQMSLAFVNQLPFVTSTIIGATKMEQLKENIASIDLNLTPEIRAQIESVHREIPNPAA
ncbi:aldo/keto reductase [Flavobacteriaceae bacterium F08102]|nr:aldo/keto reductase [Flavobacteriaceae bacterium F08102]